MKQAYSLDELWQIRAAAARPAAIAFAALVAGIVMASLTYEDTREWATGPWMCLSGGLVIAGLFGWVIYGINWIAVSRWTYEIERRHQAKWLARGGRYSLEAKPNQVNSRSWDYTRLIDGYTVPYTHFEQYDEDGTVIYTADRPKC